jgi:hypothetical protein
LADFGKTVPDHLPSKVVVRFVSIVGIGT